MKSESVLIRRAAESHRRHVKERLAAREMQGEPVTASDEGRETGTADQAPGRGPLPRTPMLSSELAPSGSAATEPSE